MRAYRLIATAVASVVLFGAGVARAEAPWSAPVTVVSGTSLLWQPELAFTEDGHAVATLAGGLSRVLAADPTASRFMQVGRAVLVAKPAVYGRDGVAYLRTPRRAPEPGRAKFARLGVSLGSVPGSLGHFRQLARVDVSRSGVVTARIAADPRGDVAAAWLEPRPPVRGSADPPPLGVRVALRRPGHAFGRATTVGEAVEYLEGLTLFDLAYGANGDLVVAFQRTRSEPVSQRTLELAVRVKRPGRGFGPLQSLGQSRGSSSIATAVAPSGAAVVAWGTQDGGEGVELPWTVRAAVLRARAHRFAGTQLLDPGRVARPVGPVSAAIGRDGTATVAWSGTSVTDGEAAYPVQVATARPRESFAAPTQLAPTGAASDVVTAGDGTTTVLWGPLTDPDGEFADGILASRRPSGASLFAAPETVSQRKTRVNRAAIALDPQTGRPAVLWIGGPGSRLQYSTRGG
jgi:hypothetical protein